MTAAWRRLLADPRRLLLLERWTIWLVALHSAIVGLMLLGAPAWSVRFAGWPAASPLFFPQQAGVFHFVVVLGYIQEFHATRGVRLLVATKTIAFVFLISTWLAGEAAWSVPFSGIADGAMGLGVALLDHWRRRAEAAAASLAAPRAAAPAASPRRV